MPGREGDSRRLNRRGASCCLVVLLLLIVGCDDMQARQTRQTRQVQILERAGDSYKLHKDYASLEVLCRHLRKGMERTEVETMLGEPDHSPIEGQYYYSSNQREAKNQRKEQVKMPDVRNMPVGLVVDYRDEQHMLTQRLQTFRLGRIGE